YNMYILTENLLDYWQPRIERKTNKKENLFIQIKTYTHPITNFTNLLTMEGRKRVRYKICYTLKICQNIPFGKGRLCNFRIDMCYLIMLEYQVDAGGKLCSYCGHVPQFIGEDIEW
ncbi:hypothetical protein Avbf_13645, partial [Armadillidium vulgare]